MRYMTVLSLWWLSIGHWLKVSILFWWHTIFKDIIGRGAFVDLVVALPTEGIRHLKSSFLNWKQLAVTIDRQWSEGKVSLNQCQVGFKRQAIFFTAQVQLPPLSYRPPCCYHGSNTSLWVTRMLATQSGFFSMSFYPTFLPMSFWSFLLHCSKQHYSNSNSLVEHCTLTFEYIEIPKTTS